MADRQALEAASVHVFLELLILKEYGGSRVTSVRFRTLESWKVLWLGKQGRLSILCGSYEHLFHTDAVSHVSILPVIWDDGVAGSFV